MGENLTKELMSKGGSHSRSHGMFSMHHSGPDALIDPEKITRMEELRAILRTQPGRDDVQHELAARLALIVEMGFGSIRERYEGDHVTTAQRLKVWKDPVINALPRYIGALQKALNALPAIDDGAYDAELKRIDEVMANDDAA